MRSPIRVRTVKNSEGELLRQIVSLDMGADLKEMDWNNIEPYWICAVQDDEIIAVCMVIVGYPIGIIEFLCFKKDYSDMKRARVIKLMAKFSVAGLVAAGCSAMVSSVPFSKKDWKNVLKRKWGCYVYSTGNLLMKRLV